MNTAHQSWWPGRVRAGDCRLLKSRADDESTTMGAPQTTARDSSSSERNAPHGSERMPSHRERAPRPRFDPLPTRVARSVPLKRCHLPSGNLAPLCRVEAGSHRSTLGLAVRPRAAGGLQTHIEEQSGANISGPTRALTSLAPPEGRPSTCPQSLGIHSVVEVDDERPLPVHEKWDNHPSVGHCAQGQGPRARGIPCTYSLCARHRHASSKEPSHARMCEEMGSGQVSRVPMAHSGSLTAVSQACSIA